VKRTISRKIAGWKAAFLPADALHGVAGTRIFHMKRNSNPAPACRYADFSI
jgi:hypothetical protein